MIYKDDARGTTYFTISGFEPSQHEHSLSTARLLARTLERLTREKRGVGLDLWLIEWVPDEQPRYVTSRLASAIHTRGVAH